MPTQPVQIVLASLITLENKRSRDDVVESAGLARELALATGYVPGFC
jgi:hypothetical protein